MNGRFHFRCRVAIVMMSCLTFFAQNLQAAHAAPEVHHDLTFSLSGRRFGVEETDRVESMVFGSRIVKGRQIDIYFARYLGTIPVSLTEFMMAVAALLGLVIYMICVNKNAVGLSTLPME